MALLEETARALATNGGGLDQSGLAYRLARLYADYNQIHPFREGNGRAGTLLLHTVAAMFGRRLNLSAVSHEEWYAASGTACRSAATGSPSTGRSCRCSSGRCARPSRCLCPCVVIPAGRHIVKSVGAQERRSHAGTPARTVNNDARAGRHLVEADSRLRRRNMVRPRYGAKLALPGLRMSISVTLWSGSNSPSSRTVVRLAGRTSRPARRGRRPAGRR